MKPGFKETAACSEELGIAKLLGLIFILPSPPLLSHHPWRTGQFRRLSVEALRGQPFQAPRGAAINTVLLYKGYRKTQAGGETGSVNSSMYLHEGGQTLHHCFPSPPASRVPSVCVAKAAELSLGCAARRLCSDTRFSRSLLRAHVNEATASSGSLNSYPGCAHAATRQSFEDRDWKPEALRGAKATSKAQLLRHVALREEEGMALPQIISTAQIS